MLAFESLTPEALLKEIAEFLRMEAERQNLTVTLLDRKSRLTRAETNRRARHEAMVSILRGLAIDLDGASILPRNSAFRSQPEIPKPSRDNPNEIERATWATLAEARAYASGVNVLTDTVLDQGGDSITVSDPIEAADSRFTVIVSRNADDEDGE